MSVGVPAEISTLTLGSVAETVTENSNDISRDCNPCNRYLDLTDADQRVWGMEGGVSL